MAEDGWKTYPIEFKGGLVSNLSLLQQGINAPGSARILKNFEPSIQGGYRRVLGYAKYDSNIIPPYGAPVVHGASQTGTTLVIASIHYTPEAGDTLTIAGVANTYTIAAAGVSYDATNKRATLTLTTSLDSSPANAAAVTFVTTTTDHSILGVHIENSYVLTARNASMFKTTGSGYTCINVPSYGTVLAAGGAQTGTSLAVDGLTAAPQAGDTFSIGSVDLIYTVTADATLAGDASTLAINPALASSPADNAAITFLSNDRSSAGIRRFARYNFSNVDEVVFVDGTNEPATYNGTTYTVLDSAPADVVGASYVVNYKNTIFYGKGPNLIHTAPYSVSDFTAASGGGLINVGGTITGLVVFRENLFIFTETSIFNLTGSTIADYTLRPVTRDIGCLYGDTIQEVGTDVMFLAPDGIRLLSATDRVGDFNLGVVSKVIQPEFASFISAGNHFTATVIRGKSQYRLFSHTAGTAQSASRGIIGAQLQGEEGAVFAFSELVGIKVYSADSYYISDVEYVLFGNEDGYLYRMESGNSFNGTNIAAIFATPHMPFEDPRIRKTFYRAVFYLDPEGSVSFGLNLKLDFEGTSTIQPSTIAVTTLSGTTGQAVFGEAIFGTAVFGASNYEATLATNLIGSGYTGSFYLETDDMNPPFALDALTIEYATHSRR